MTVSDAGHAGTYGSKIAAALRNPLYRSGYALVVNTIATTLVGVGYWAVATHLYSQEQVGRASALVAALIMVSSIAQLNLSNTLPRFLPSAKRRAGRLILYCYSASSVAAALGGALFVIGMPAIGANWRFVDASAEVGALFVLAVAIWGVFALEDAALTGLHRATVVPFENTAYGVVKLAMLVMVASALPATGIFVSWIAPLVLCVPVINWLIFFRYLPKRETARQGSEVAGRSVVRHASMDYVGSLFSQAYANLPALMVLTVLGAVANGYFYIAWTIGAGLGLVGANFSTSLLVEGAAAPGRLAELTRGTLLRCMVVMVPAAAVFAVGSRLVLLIYGSQYAAHAAMLLVLLAVAAIPRSLMMLAISLDRIAGRVGRAALTQFLVAALVLGASWVLLRPRGIDGVGIAWLGSHVLVAAFRMPALISASRRPAERHAAGQAPDAPAPDAPAAAPVVTRWQPAVTRWQPVVTRWQPAAAPGGQFPEGPTVPFPAIRPDTVLPRRPTGPPAAGQPAASQPAAGSATASATGPATASASQPGRHRAPGKHRALRNSPAGSRGRHR